MVDSKSKVLANNIALKSIKLHNAERNFEQPRKDFEFVVYTLFLVLFLYFIYDSSLLSETVKSFQNAIGTRIDPFAFFDRTISKLIEMNRFWGFIILSGIFLSLCPIACAAFVDGLNKENDEHVRLAERLRLPPLFILYIANVPIGFAIVICDLDVFGRGFFMAIISCFAYLFTFFFVAVVSAWLFLFPFHFCKAFMYVVRFTFSILIKFNIYLIGESLIQDINELNNNISPVMLPILNSMGGGTLGEIYNEVNKSLEFISVDVLKVLLSNHESIEILKFDEYVCYKSKLVSGGSNMKTVILDDE